MKPKQRLNVIPSNSLSGIFAYDHKRVPLERDPFYTERYFQVKNAILSHVGNLYGV